MLNNMSKSDLAIALSKLKGFEKPKVKLEQYTTDPEMAAEILWSAFMQGDIKDKVIADLGAGTGTLGIGALLLGAKKVFFVEKDDAAIAILRKNLEKIRYSGQAVSLNQDIMFFTEKVDAVLMNPPFGTKEKHADQEFLERAMKTAPIVYSLHKIETKGFIDAFIQSHSFKTTHFWRFKMALKASMKHHRKPKGLVNIGCWRVVKNG
jgi:putative methylase